VCIPQKGIEGSNPSVSAEGDKSTKHWFVPSLFSITLPDLPAIMANMEFTFSVRNSSFLPIIEDSFRKDQFLQVFFEPDIAGSPHDPEFDAKTNCFLEVDRQVRNRCPA
jgi:hypothetical protein